LAHRQLYYTRETANYKSACSKKQACAIIKLMDTVEQKKAEELKKIFHLSVKFLRQRDFAIAREGFEIVVRQAKEGKKRSFFSRIFKGPSLRDKAVKYLKRVSQEEARLEAKQRKKTEKLPAEEKSEEPIMTYEEELEAKQKELEERYQKDLEEQLNEMLRKQRELEREDKELRKAAVEEVTDRERLRQRMAEQQEEFERRKAELKERYEQELERTKQILEERRTEEIEKWKERARAEEAKKKQRVFQREGGEPESREAEAQKVKEEVPEKRLSREEEAERKKDILRMEEELREKRKLIEEEAQKIEQEDLKRKQEQLKRQNLAGDKEAGGDKEKRRAWLRGTIKKEQEARDPKEIEKEQKEKTESLKKLFKEALFYYREKEFDRAVEVFWELKRELPEPTKEPGFFARITGKVPLYVKIEDYIAKTEKQKKIEEKKKIQAVRERAKIASAEKRKTTYRSFAVLKRKAGKLLPASPWAILGKVLFFPPLVAIDISDYSIEILRLGKRATILSYGRTIIKEGVVSGGEIKQQKELSQAFKFVANQAGFKPFRARGGPIMRGIISIPEYKTNIQTFNLESRGHIFEKVKEKVKQTVPFPVEELYWDYVDSWDEQAKQTKVLCVAVPRDIIDEQIYFFKSSGVDPAVFDIEAAAVGRALLPEKNSAEKQSILILDIGAKVSNINIFDESGLINLSTATPNAGHYLITKIADYFGISQEEAETVIKLKGFHEENSLVWQVLEEGMEKIAEKAKEALRHYQRLTGKEVKKMILAGGTALLPGIDDFLKSRFRDIDVEVGDPLKKIKRRGGLDPTKALLYTNSIGLALRGIIKDPVGTGINLLPGKIKEKEKKVYWQRHRQKRIIINIILIVIIALAGIIVYTYLVDDFLGIL